MEKNKKKLEKDWLLDCYSDEELEELDNFIDEIVRDAEEEMRKRKLDPNAKPIKNPILSEDGESVIIEEVTFNSPKKRN